MSMLFGESKQQGYRQFRLGLERIRDVLAVSLRCPMPGFPGEKMPCIFVQTVERVNHFKNRFSFNDGMHLFNHKR